MRILIDSREQAPFAFLESRYKGIVTEVASLPTGDYSLPGLTDLVAIERKSLDDLLGCLTRERGRFERELARARGLELFAVIVEGSMEQLARGRYRSRMQPHAACQSVLAMQARGTAFIFAGSRQGAEYCCWSLLCHFLEGARKRYAKIITASEDQALAT